MERSRIKTEYGMKSWDNEYSISVFVFHVRKVFVPVVTGKITGQINCLFSNPIYTILIFKQTAWWYGPVLITFLRLFTIISAIWQSKVLSTCIVSKASNPHCLSCWKWSIAAPYCAHSISICHFFFQSLYFSSNLHWKEI